MNVRLPLLLGGRPKYVSECPLVPLGIGVWKITSNHKDSRLLVDCGPSCSYPLEEGLSINGPVNVRVMIIDKGDEEYIDIYAERINGSN